MNSKFETGKHNRRKLIAIAIFIFALCIGVFFALQSPDIRRSVGLEKPRPEAKMMTGTYRGFDGKKVE